MTNLQIFNSWLSAFRLRTLPLALSSIIMGSFLAATHNSSTNQFDIKIFGLCISTTILLQILSNLANDYGDSQHGADSKDRKGPQRAVQAGLISAQAMKNAMLLFAILALMSGLALLWVALGNHVTLFLTFLGLGIVAIIAAVTYTAGAKPYGYAGLGDISVLIFFGLVGVMGCYFLYAKNISWDLLLPAISCGAFSVAVLNINNIRDIESDFKAGKLSIPVRLGREKAVIYHFVLLFLGLSSAIIYTVLHWQNPIQLLFLITLPLLLRNVSAVQKNTNPQELDPYLKQMALTTLLFVLSFGLGLYLTKFIG
jgi:1,4-dihydroxy-2-naphthoate octaprenyltransferase